MFRAGLELPAIGFHWLMNTTATATTTTAKNKRNLGWGWEKNQIAPIAPEEGGELFDRLTQLPDDHTRRQPAPTKNCM